MLKVGFYGSSSLSLEILKVLYRFDLEGRLNLSYIVSSSSKPYGRLKKILDNPVVDFCKSNQLLVKTPESLKLFETPRIDIAFVAAYGKIIPQKILDTATYGFLNFHGSILPKYRGATPIQTAILNRDESTGLTVIKMDSGMDTGPILYTEIFSIKENDNTEILMEKLARRSAAFVENLFDVLIAHPNNWVLREQDNDNASYCKVQDFNKSSLQIFYNDSQELALGKVLSGYPEPIAWFYCEALKKNINLISAESSAMKFQEKIEDQIHPILFYSEKELFLSLRKGSIKVLSLQVEGKKTVDSAGFINGYQSIISRE